MMSQAPRKIGRYEVLDEIGRGAMGVVYRARDPLIGREVALKALRISVALSREEAEQFRQRFIREAQSAGMLSHPNIVTIHDIVESGDEGLTYIAMEFVAGETLRHLLSSAEAFSLELAVDLIRQVADGLDYAHSKGVVHRDIKPANILIADGNRAKITDFGIARVNASNLTLDGQLLGTPNYMAPEQIVGREVDHRADLFSLGVVFYETLTRHKPFPGENLTTVAHRVVYEPFEPAESYLPDLPSEICEVLRKALEKEPGKRYQRGSEFSLALQRAFQKARGEATAPTVLLPQRPPGPAEVATVVAPVGSQHLAPTLVTERPPTREISPPAAPQPAAPQPAAPQPAARAPRAEAKAPGKRGALPLTIGVLALLALVLAAGLGWIWMKGKSAANVPEQAPLNAPDRPPEYVAAVAEGQRLLVAGDPSGAAAAFAQAERLAPSDQTARSLREEAERQAAMVAVQPSPAKAPPAGPMPGEPAPALAAPPVSPPAAARVEAPGRPRAAAPAEAGPATLAVDLHSEISPGVLTIYIGREQIYREGFRFVRRSGLKRTAIPGDVRATRTVAAGDAEIKVILALEGKPTKVVTLQGNLPGGRERRLKIGVSADGGVEAKLE